VRSALC